MKMILASDQSFLLKHGYDATGIPKDKINIGYVTTASKGARSQSFFDNVKNTISEHGYKFEEIDITGKSKDDLRDFFKDKNIVHIEGGNAFYLLKKVRETGFAEILSELLNEGKVYIGTSAGAYIMCPTIEVADWDESGKDRFELTDFSALNYVPFVIKAHYTDEQNQKIIARSKALKYPLRVLRDGQGILIENNKTTFLGGEETLINQD